jgi:hypothetical protein
MHPKNGGSVYTHLEARLAELERALSLLSRRWERELVPRLVRIEREVDTILHYLESGSDETPAPSQEEA